MPSKRASRPLRGKGECDECRRRGQQLWAASDPHFDTGHYCAKCWASYGDPPVTRPVADTATNYCELRSAVEPSRQAAAATLLGCTGRPHTGLAALLLEVLVKTPRMLRHVWWAVRRS